jgi:hypothetical protein
MADGAAWPGAMQEHLRGPEWKMIPQGALRVAVDEGPMATARLAVVPPRHPIGALAAAGEAVSLGAGMDEAAHQAAVRQA